MLTLFTARIPAGETGSQQKVTPSLFGVSEWNYTSSQICRRCHPDHWDMWSHSMHALSVDDPIFQVSYLQAQVEGSGNEREYCLTCHAPLTNSNRDYSLNSVTTREGVACDFCHTVTDVHIGRKPFPYDNKPGATKYGPLGSAPNPAHRSRESALYKTAEFCGGCHELVNDNGVTVMGTYSEWRNSPYSEEGVHCQNCHMPLSMSYTAVTLDGDTVRNMAHDHRFQGGHSRINLKHAAKIELYTQIFDHTAQVTVLVTNEESGHRLPTGMPGRKLILKVRVYDQDGDILAQPTRIYRKVLVDSDGTILEGNSSQILNAVKIYNDNRIAPRERRKEEFLVDLPDYVTAVKVDAELLYEYETPVMYTQTIQTEMATANLTHPIGQVQASTNQVQGKAGWIALILVILAVIAVLFLIVIRRLRSNAQE